MKFYAFSGYFYIARFLGLKGIVSPSSLSHAAKQHCRIPWGEAIHQYENNDYLPNYCFNSTYVYLLLAGSRLNGIDLGYGFPMESSYVEVAEKLSSQEYGEQEVSWTLGAAITEIEKIRNK